MRRGEGGGGDEVAGPPVGETQDLHRRGERALRRGEGGRRYGRRASVGGLRAMMADPVLR